MDDLHHEALRARFYDGESYESIERRLGIAFNDSIMSELLTEITSGPVRPATRPGRRLTRRSFGPIGTEPIDVPNSFRTRDGLVVELRRVPAVAATDVWQALLDDAVSSGLWPIVLSETVSGCFQEHVIDGATEDGRPPASSLIELGSRLDARGLLDGWSRERSSPAGERTDYRGSSEVRRLLESSSQAILIPASDDTVIGLFPGGDSYEIPAILGYGGWNGSPGPAEHVAILKYWQERYGARLLALAHDTIELAVSRPPRPGDDALSVARDHRVYGSNLLCDSVGVLAAWLPESRYWNFWWD